MAIQFEILFDQVVIRSRKFNIKIEEFVSDEIDLFTINEDSIPIITENLPLRLLFKSNNPADRLYLDLLDSVPFESIYTDDFGAPYVAPSENEYIIYDNTNDYLALVPGYYKLCVVCNNQSFFSLVKVTSKQINEFQWLAMRDEIEQTVSGLAKDVIQKKLGSQSQNDGNIIASTFNKIELIKKNYRSWNATMNVIGSSPKYKIIRDFVLNDRNRITNLDPVTISNLSRSNKPRIKAGINTISYDLPENNILKYYISLTLKESKNLIKEISSLSLNISNEINGLNQFKLNKNTLATERLNKALIDLASARKLLENIRNKCLEMLGNYFLKDIKISKNTQSVVGFNNNVHYKKIEHFYKLFEEQNISVKMSLEYEYCWKRTDRLYELWGFIQFIKALQNLGYQIDKELGTFLDISTKVITGENVPFLSENTKVIFVKGTLKIQLVYDTRLPYKSVPLDVCPLHAETSNNRPDLRLDVYDEGQYLGSVLIDFKYRPLRNIWTNGPFIPKDDSSSKRQLFEYKNSIVSEHFLKDSPLAKRISAVREVWAIFPNNPRNNNIISNVERIRLVELTPLDENKAFIDLLDESLKGLVEEADMIKFFTK